MTSKPTRPAGEPPALPRRPTGSHAVGQTQQVRDVDVASATFGYLGAIFLGPIIPLAIFLLRGRKSAFMRFHATTAVNLSLTVTLYGISCLILGGLLLLDSLTVALVIGLTLGFALWLTMLKYLIRGVIAANRFEEFEVPSWICARIVTLVTR